MELSIKRDHTSWQFFVFRMILVTLPLSFYRKYKHFVPVHKNLSNFKQKILWAKENDLHTQEIARDSSNFASKYLSEEAELCYWYYLLHEYAALQNFVPTEPHKNARPAINYDNIGYYTKWHSDKNAQSAALYKRKKPEASYFRAAINYFRYYILLSHFHFVSIDIHVFFSGIVIAALE